VRDHAIGIEELLDAEAVAARAGANRRVEGKQSGLQLLQAVVADRTGVLRGQQGRWHLRVVDRREDREPVAEPERGLERLGQALLDVGARAEADGRLRVVLAHLVAGALQKLAQSGRYDALVAIGCVIRGDTYHFEIVCNESARGILDVQLETGVPIANVILTVESEEQAHVRISEKGSDGARVAVEMANFMKRI